MDNEEQPKRDFRVQFSTNDPMSYLAQQMFELRVAVGALSIIALELLALAGKDREEIAKSYASSLENLRLQLAFELQDSGEEKSGE